MKEQTEANRIREPLHASFAGKKTAALQRQGG